MSIFKAQQQKKYTICFVRDTSPETLREYKTTPDLESAEEERRIMLDDVEYLGCDIRIREDVVKTSWYAYS